MNTALFDRIRREIALTVESARETILAIADRVNRKAQSVKLHCHAAEMTRHIALTQQEIGGVVVETLVSREHLGPSHGAHNFLSLDARLEEAAATLRVLRTELARIDQSIMDLEAETLSDDLLRLQRDLSGRALTIERLTVAPEAQALGVSINQLPLSPATRVIAVFRGPALLGDGATANLRGGDVILLLGTRNDLQHDRLRFTQRARATA